MMLMWEVATRVKLRLLLLFERWKKRARELTMQIEITDNNRCSLSCLSSHDRHFFAQSLRINGSFFIASPFQGLFRETQIWLKSSEATETWEGTLSEEDNNNGRWWFRDSLSHFLRNWLSFSFPPEMMPASISDLLLLLLTWLITIMPLFASWLSARSTTKRQVKEESESKIYQWLNEDSHERLWGNNSNRISLSNIRVIAFSSLLFAKVACECKTREDKRAIYRQLKLGTGKGSRWHLKSDQVCYSPALPENLSSQRSKASSCFPSVLIKSWEWLRVTSKRRWFLCWWWSCLLRVLVFDLLPRKWRRTNSNFNLQNDRNKTGMKKRGLNPHIPWCRWTMSYKRSVTKEDEKEVIRSTSSWRRRQRSSSSSQNGRWWRYTRTSKVMKTRLTGELFPFLIQEWSQEKYEAKIGIHDEWENGIFEDDGKDVKIGHKSR